MRKNEVTRGYVSSLRLPAKSPKIFTPEQAFSFGETTKNTVLVPSGIWLTGAPLFWTQGIKGKGAKIAVIDSGIDNTHPDLRHVVTKLHLAGDVMKKNMHYHGTHVAGIIGANGFLRGIAPEAKIYDYRVFDGIGRTSYLQTEKAIIKAADDGCNIINLSLGGNDHYPELEKAVNYATKKGSLIVAAAGNEGEGLEWDTSSYCYPASYGNVLSVASIDFKTHRRNPFVEANRSSNRNSMVDVCSTGQEVISTFPGGFYGYLSGTSMACPHVTGFSALLYNKSRCCKRKRLKGEKLFVAVKMHTTPIDLGCCCEKMSTVRKITGAGIVTNLNEVPTRDDLSDSFRLRNLNCVEN